MQILPLKFIVDEDRLLVDDNLITLAKIKRAGFPVAEILVISPPLELKQTFKKFQPEKPIFEHNFEAFHEEILKIPLPDDFRVILKREKNLNQIWQRLLSLWAKEIRSKIMRDEIKGDFIDTLKAKELAFVDNILASGRFSFDTLKKDSVIEIEEGTLTPLQLYNLDKMALELNKKLLIPQIFFWILEEHNKKKEFKIIKILPFTEHKMEELKDFQEVQNIVNIKNQEKSATKIFLQPKDSLTKIEGYLNGILLQISDFDDSEKAIIYLVKKTKELDTIIFQISNENIKTLKEEIEVFIFLRNKEKIKNIELGLPPVKSCLDFTEIKKNLSSLGIYRKGLLKFWLELGYPENLINIDEYILSGFDGAILNLDLLNYYLNGGETKYTKTLLKFLENSFKPLHASKIPILIKGEIALNGELLKFLIKAGIWGIMVSSFNHPGLNNYLRMIEESIVRD